MLDDNSKEDQALKAALLIVKKELEEKTGVFDKKTKEKKAANQEEILKRIKDSKKKKKAIDIDIFILKRSRNYDETINVENVIEAIKQKMWDSPKDPLLLNIGGVAYMVAGDYQKAEMEFKKLDTIEKGNPDLMYNVGELLFRKGNYQEALEQLRNVLRKNSEDYDALYLMAIILYMKNGYGQSLAYLAQGLKSDREFDRVHKFFTMLSLLKRNAGKAQEILKKMLEKDIKNISARVAYMYLLITSGDLKSFSEQDEILEGLTQKDSTINYPCVLVNSGLLHKKNHNLSIAEAVFLSAQKENPKCICAYIERSRILCEMERIEEANEEIGKAITTAPFSLAVLGEVLKIYWYLSKNSAFNYGAEIEMTIDKILEIDKEHAIVIYSKEKILFRMSLAKIRKNFIEEMNAILRQNSGEYNVNFRSENNEEMAVLKLFRNIKLCEKICGA